MGVNRPRLAWEDWALAAGLTALAVGVVGTPVSLLLGAGLWARASLSAIVASVLLMRLVSAFGRSYPDESPVDRMVRRFRRQLDRDLKKLR